MSLKRVTRVFDALRRHAGTPPGYRCAHPGYAAKNWQGFLAVLLPLARERRIGDDRTHEVDLAAIAGLLKDAL
jgi:hypothetical protein